MNKGEKLGQLAPCLNFLKDGLMWDNVEGVCYIHLKHHPIGVDIQSNSNTHY
jgi:hypothetical protein